MKKEPVTFTQLMNVDIRVGKVTHAQRVENSNKLIELTVDLGSDYGTVTIFTGMQKWHTPEDFIDKKFPFVANLEPKQMMGKNSQGMILSVDNKGVPILIPLSDSAETGMPVL